ADGFIEGLLENDSYHEEYVGLKWVLDRLSTYNTTKLTKSYSAKGAVHAIIKADNSGLYTAYEHLALLNKDQFSRVCATDRVIHAICNKYTHESSCVTRSLGPKNIMEILDTANQEQLFKALSAKGAIDALTHNPDDNKHNTWNRGNVKWVIKKLESLTDEQRN